VIASMIEQPLDASHSAIAVVIMAIGSALQGSVGIGLALFVVPLLALVDRSFIPGPMLFAGVLLALITAYRERTAIDAAALRSSLIGLAGGTIVGVVTLKFVSGSGSHLDQMFGALVLLAVVIGISGAKFDATPRLLMLAGGASGVMGAMVGIHGPPISLALQNTEPRVVRAMLGVFFSVAYVGSVAVLAVFGLFGMAELLRAAILLPGVVIGVAAAPLLARYIDGKRLRLIILAIAAVSGLTLLMR
jgi:uncharacterized membrane protein YfcA